MSLFVQETEPDSEGVDGKTKKEEKDPVQLVPIFGWPVLQSSEIRKRLKDKE